MGLLIKRKKCQTNSSSTPERCSTTHCWPEDKSKSRSSTQRLDPSPRPNSRRRSPVCSRARPSASPSSDSTPNSEEEDQPVSLSSTTPSMTERSTIKRSHSSEMPSSRRVSRPESKRRKSREESRKSEERQRLPPLVPKRRRSDSLYLSIFLNFGVVAPFSAEAFTGRGSWANKPLKKHYNCKK